MDSLYPDTRRTWLLECLATGEPGLRELRAQLMEVYVDPLRQTCRARLGLDAEDALDLVHGFFASRLARPEYFGAWSRSGLPLRHWLWNGLCLHRRERRRDDRRSQTIDELRDTPDTDAPDPGVELERNFAIAIVRAAMRRAEATCRADGFDLHWQVFVRHATGEALPAIARDLGLSDNQALVRLRAPRRRFVDALSEILVADGVPRAEVARALRELAAVE